MSGSGRPCPACGDTMYQQGALGVYWCPECEMEYWREGNGWWRCDESGEPEKVKAVADGGTSGRCRLPEFVDEGRVWGATVRCEDCGYSVNFDGDETHEQAREKWFSDEHRGRHDG